MDNNLRDALFHNAADRYAVAYSAMVANHQMRGYDATLSGIFDLMLDPTTARLEEEEESPQTCVPSLFSRQLLFVKP